MQLSDLDFSKSYTYADYLKWTFEERIELIKGKLFKMSPAPNRAHQKLSQQINLQLLMFLNGKSCEVYTAPFDVRLPRKTQNSTDVITVVQPDLCVICDPTKLDDKGCYGAPDIVVEILSQGNNKKELSNKYEVYEESGVKEYWIIHPQERTFLRNVLTEQGTYQASRLMTSGDEVNTPVLPGFTLYLDKLFDEL